jgi:hypothetical protein
MEKIKKGKTSVEFLTDTMIQVVSGGFALVAQRTASNAYLVHMLSGEEYNRYLKDKDGYEFPEQPPNPDIAKLFGTLGNPGIFAHVKKEHYNDFVDDLKRRGQFHDLQRTGGRISETPFREWQYNKEITACDFSNEQFGQDDMVVHVWCVDIKHKKA